MRFKKYLEDKSPIIAVDDNLKILIRRTDTALYEAKRTGKNKTVIAD